MLQTLEIIQIQQLKDNHRNRKPANYKWFFLLIFKLQIVPRDFSLNKENLIKINNHNHTNKYQLKTDQELGINPTKNLT